MPSNTTTGTSDAIEQYRQAKSDYLRLRNQAKKELIARFHQTANELFQIQHELLEDFGEKIAIPAKGKKIRQVKDAKAPARKAQSASPEPAAVSPQVASLQQQLQRARKKLAETQAAGKPAKAVEDRIYELEDAIRLALSKHS